ncbi:DUF4214 domain-containing protein [Jannaschia aquimarina]|uniref:Cysteine-rich secretory protein family protein n=1 Tax=Jannaschia aquimarina TaxID=935700 RepID=A0A0D1EFF2_9RHOB|nr:DUF4214 domain-containing protein [Jannaschia aquimarina]KIT15621.1 Cysteine-rich secretory protein family protein [Jannaschia aquimarina]SNT27842.1 protein of unknown function [Jannaschia aquimarina]
MSTTHTPTDFEQMMLELVNRARRDPEGEIVDAVGPGVQSNVASAMRYFGVDVRAYEQQLSALDPVAPLAWNGKLADAAAGHTARLVEEEAQTHQFPDGPSMGERIRDAGYRYNAAAENVYSHTDDPVQGHAGFFIDWGFDSGETEFTPNFESMGDGIQDPAGHRNNIMSTRYTEIGIAAQETGPDLKVGPWVVTQNFGNRFDYEAQLVGVVIDDLDGDDFYDIGEGLDGITVTATGSAGTFTTTTWDSGGYQMVLPRGDYTVTFTGAEIDGSITASATIADENVKVDAIADEAAPPIESVVRGSEGDDRLLADEGAELQIVVGGGGSDEITDADGDHLLVGDALAAGYFDVADDVYRMYRATFDRDPDAAGFAAWSERLLLGLSDAELAEAFIGAPEFRAVYGSLGDQAFIEQLYLNVLGRAADETGLANWVARLQSGMDRADVLVGFSNSPEFVSNTAGAARTYAIESDAAAWTDDVYRLYRATLDRDPDAKGLANWSGRLAGGTEYLDVATGFIASPEFQATYGSLSNREFVSQLYRNVLDREGDATGLANWTARLDSGADRAEIVRGFAQSAEFVAGTRDDAIAYIRSLGTDDTIRAGSGDDVMLGGALSDVFEFGENASGTVRVLDFEAWDSIDLSGHGFADETSARRAFEQIGEDAVLELNDLTVTLIGVRAADLADDQILLA